MSLLLNYTTKIEPQQTIGEIQLMLADYGVEAIMTEYDGKQVSAVSFKMNVEGKTFPFRMPCNWRGVYEIIKRPEYNRVSLKDKEAQAVRVAWRILHTWVKSQLTLVEVNMVTIPQVFLPYTIMKDGRTLSETVSDNPTFLLQ
jgi:hypothetical protein